MRAVVYRRWLIATVACGMLALAPGGALAATQTAQSGNVVATFSYQGTFATHISQLHLQISRAGAVAYDTPVSSTYCTAQCFPGSDSTVVHVLDLDANGEPEVVLDLWSGGADCCFIEQVFSFDPGSQTYVVTQRNFANPGARLEDISHDGHWRFISGDNNFVGEFTSVAQSGAPIQIWKFEQRKFTDVTRSYPDLIKSDAAHWWQLFQSNLDNGTGYIADWAADEDLLGRESHVQGVLDDEATKGDLRNLSMGVQPEGRKFVASLDKFLREHGYVTEQKCSTKPIKTKDKKLDIKGCFTPSERGTYVSTGDVEVNGLKFSPHKDGQVTIDPAAPSLKMGGTGTVSLGEITIWNWSATPQVTIPLSRTVSLKRNRDMKIFGFPVSGSLQVTFGLGDVTATGEVSLRVLGEDITATAVVRVDAGGVRSATVSAQGAGEDPKFHELSSCSLNRPPPLGFECASVTNAKGNTYSGLVPKEPSIVHLGPLPVQDVSFSYDRDKHEWSGQGVLSIGDLLPGGLGKALPELGLGATIGTGRSSSTAAASPTRI